MRKFILLFSFLSLMLYSCNTDELKEISCTDGIKNGNETGIDCGGDCPDVCFSCDDGVQNGNEEGIDCGGDCPDTCYTCDDGIQNGYETGIDCGGNCPDCYTWTGDKITEEQIRDVFFINDNIGYIAAKMNSSGQNLFKSVNSGDTWSSLNVGINGDVHSVWFINENEGFINIEKPDNPKGYIYKTTDGGLSWNEIANANFSIAWDKEIHFNSNDTGFVIEPNASGFIPLYTTDRGLTWKKDLVGFTVGYEIGVSAITFLDNSKIGYLTGWGEIYKSVNGGIDWVQVYKIRETMITTTGIHFTDENNGYCLMHDSILHTTNGGTIWNTINSNDGGDKFIFNNNSFYLVNRFGYALYKSDDYCVTFDNISQDIIPHITGLIEDIFVTPNGTVVVVTDNGYVFKSNN